MMEPDLSVVLFRRIGLGTRRLRVAGGDGSLDAQVAFVQPTSWNGEKVGRLCFVNPRTTIDHVHAVLGTMV